MQRVSRDHIQRVLAEQETLNAELEKKRKQLDSWSRELNKREALTERDRQKLDEEKNKVINFRSTVQPCLRMIDALDYLAFSSFDSFVLFDMK